MLQDENGNELAPCIVSRAKFHLGLPNRYSHNEKSCSDAYWNRTIDVLIRLHYVPANRIRMARRMKDFLN